MSRSEFLEESTAAGVVAKARTYLSGDAQFFSSQPNFDQIRKQLDSDSLSSKKEAMKRIVAQIALGNNMSVLFPEVVKNIHAASIELRKLIYYFIIHYSEERPNEALLSISAFQHDLLDSSMHVRALALRTLSSIRIAAINPVVLVAIKKASTDLAPLVRRTAALAITKANRIAKGEDNTAQLIPIIQQLLGDRSMDVVGAAASTFLQLCPNRFDLVHKHFRRICRGLMECDEWGQIHLLHLLSRYARNQFTHPDKKKTKVVKKVKVNDSDSSDSEPSEDERDALTTAFDLDTDHRLLLQSVKPMFTSLNRAVVLACVSIYYHIAPQTELDICAKPLLRVLSGESDGHYVALITIQTVLAARSKAFTPYIRDFYLAPYDSVTTRQLRLRILARLTTKDNLMNVLTEVKSYLTSYDYPKVVDAIRCLGLITYTVADATPAVIKIILPLLSHRNESVVTEAVVVLRQLVVQSADKAQTCQIVLKLAQRILKKEVTAATAKASIVWLVGENIRTHPNVAKIAPDMFRTFVKTFVEEESAVKSQVMLLGAKIWVNLEGEGELADRFKAMLLHLLELVKYDKDYDIRDQGRLVQTSLDRASGTFEALKTTLLAPRPLPQQSDTSRVGLHVGSMSHVLGTVVSGYEDVADWPEEQPDPTTRDPPKASSSSSSSSGDSSDDDDSSSDSGSSDDSSDGSSSDSAPARGAAKGRRAKDSSSSSEEDSDDSDAGPKAPVAKPLPKAIAAPVRVKIVSKVVGKVPVQRDRVAELFAPKPAATAAAAASTSPQQKPAAPPAAAAAFTDAVVMRGVSVSYRVTPGDNNETVHVELRVVNQRDEPLSSVKVSEDHELGDRLVEAPDAVADVDANATATLRLTLELGYPSVIIPLELDGDDEEIVPVTVTLPEQA